MFKEITSHIFNIFFNFMLTVLKFGEFKIFLWLEKIIYTRPRILTFYDRQY
jgi:hypothetical protein